MKSADLDVLVIGAGQAGLSIGYYLKELGVCYAIFEKGKIGETWRTQRWDSFKMNTPNKVNYLPGQKNGFSDEDGYCTSSEFVSYMEGYSMRFQLEIIDNCEVLSVEDQAGSEGFVIQVSEKGTLKKYLSREIVIASGAQNKVSKPAFAGNIDREVLQLHTSEYKNASALPDGAVLVVGSAQSGVQIAEDLILNGRKVFISTSQVARVPRRYRGRDIVDWLFMTGFYDVRTSDVADKQILSMKQPQVSNTGLRGHTLSLQGLAGSGAVILGKMENYSEGTGFFKPNAAENVRFADDSSKRFKLMIDDYIQRSLIPAPAAENDPDDDPDEAGLCSSSITSLNLKKNNIASVIWTTGFKGDFSYLKIPVLENTGVPKQKDGISDVNGLFFLGNPWLRKRKSGIIPGIEEDAGFIAERLSANLKT